MNINKRIGWTSNDVVRKIRQIFKQRKVGHGGTLDPIATGVLPISLGNASRLISFLLDSEKSYVITITMGTSTDTYDSTGKVLHSGEWGLLEERDICGAISKFKGKIQQIPPMYSALRYQGRRLYEIARKGGIVKREPRDITITSIKMINYNPPNFTLDVTCSRGFYARSLANDIGIILKVPTHMSALHRTMTGNFKIEESYSIEDCEQALLMDQLDDLMLPIDYTIQYLPKLSLTDNESRMVCHGQSIKSKFHHNPSLSENKETIRLYDMHNSFLGLARLNEDKTILRPFKIMHYGTDGINTLGRKINV